MALTERSPLHNVVDELREEIVGLRKRVADLQARIEQLEKDQERKPGRK
jgi:ubiquinone biosynthesis protein UbiJ